MNKKEWLDSLKELLRKIDITNIKSVSLYEEAFCHKSYANEHNLSYNQQRLEFLGDTAIGWIITNYVYNIKPKLNEGEMTILKSKLVRTDILAKAALELHLEKLLLLGNGATKTKISDKILEDTFEAFCGAIAQDQGIKKVIKLLDLTLVKYHKENLIKLEKDYKTQFQEHIQSTTDSSEHKIEYIHETEGDVKVCKLMHMGITYGVGKAGNFKDAEQDAARQAMAKCQLKGK